MSIDIHETVREKINEWKLKKAEKKKNTAELPLPQESGISLQNDSSVIETRSPEKEVRTGNEENPSLQLKIRGKNTRNKHLQSPQIKSFRRRPRIEFIDKDFDLP